MKFLIVFIVALIASSSAYVIGEGRITGGKTAVPGQFPYQVGLALTLIDNSDGWCGGSLIGHEWVLTAAHCTDYAESAIVYLGSTELTKAELTFNVNKEQFIIHAEYDSETLKNDISLIRIPYVSYTELIQPVPLPAIADKYSSYVGDFAVASGWGYVKDTATNVADTLQYGVMPVISNYACSLTYGELITPTNICVTTSRGSSTCSGDSGGPLVWDKTGELIGITSFVAIVGCQRGYPAGFTRVTSYLDWIKEYTNISY